MNVNVLLAAAQQFQNLIIWVATFWQASAERANVDAVGARSRNHHCRAGIARGLAVVYLDQIAAAI